MQKADKQHRMRLQTEKTRLASIETERLATYLLAMCSADSPTGGESEVQRRRAGGQEGLNPVALDRLVKFLEPNNKTSQAVVALDGWRKLPAPVKGVTEPSADVRRAAEDFKKNVSRPFRAFALPNAKAQAGEQSRQELLKALVR